MEYKDNLVNLSVIVCTYNSNLNKIKMTLDSIIQQDYKEFEIIITDDGSKNNYFAELKKYFCENNFNRYILNCNLENKGNVKNIISALGFSQGKYIKCLGPGDFLYNKQILSKIMHFVVEKKSLITFGDTVSYSIDNNNQICKVPFTSPVHKSVYISTNYNYKLVKKFNLFYNDWISGAILLCEKDKFLFYLQKIEDEVIYTEDIAQALYTLNEEKIDYFNENLIWYEFGTGISTSSNKEWKNMLTKDCDNFYKRLLVLYPNNKDVKKVTSYRKRYTTIFFKVIYKVEKASTYFIYKLKYGSNDIVNDSKESYGFLHDQKFTSKYNIYPLIK